MIKTLAIKELRESLGIIALAALAMLYLLGTVTGWKFTPWSNTSSIASSVPFLNSDFTATLVIFGGGLAIALGLKQSAWENVGNRYYFLLHRPLERETVFLVKMMVGCTAVLLLTSVPVLLYGWWAATPGHHASPFFWAMTIDEWRACLVMPSIYLGAVLSGIRPARWYASRLLPLVGACLFCVVGIGLWFAVGWWLAVAILFALDAVLLVLILSIARQRDY